MTIPNVLQDALSRSSSRQKSTLCFIFCLSFLSFFACTEEAKPTPVAVDVPMDSTSFTVSNITIEDIADHGNASDISVTFSLPDALDAIEAFKIIVFEAEAANQVKLATVHNLEASAYTSVTNVEANQALSLPENLLTFKGNPVQENRSYRLAILSEGSFNGQSVALLSAFSEAFTITSAALQVTTLVNDLEASGGLSIDKEGNVYCSNYGIDAAGNEAFGTNVLKITPSGVVSTQVDNLQGPSGSIVDSKGTMYIANKSSWYEGTITKVSPDGSRTTFTLPGYLAGLKVDSQDNLYAANYSQGRINKITPEGEVSVFRKDTALAGVIGMDFDEEGNLWAGNFSNGNFFKISPDGSQMEQMGTIPTVYPRYVIGYMVYFEGAFYATGIGANKIYKINLDGSFEEFAGSGALETKDGELKEAGFAAVNGIIADKSRRILYFSQFAPGYFALRKIQF
ncbi:MAG: hypothetical protein ACFB0B_08895 [Thermonemataceae bacterium]